jgi:hypothetical protein
MTPEDKFWAILTHKRDEGLAHLTNLIERNGIDEICDFLSKHVIPLASDDYVCDPASLVQHLMAHMAIVGAVDSMLAWRDSITAEDE